MAHWELVRCAVDDFTAQLNLMAEDWQPFGIDNGWIWFRRVKE